MKALVYTAEQQLDYGTMLMAQAGADEVLVKVTHVGICGSDMHAYLGHDERRPAPLILGHEAAGVIVGGTHSGKRVTVNPLTGCGVCKTCRSGQANLCTKRQIISMPPRQGAFAEFVVAHQDNVLGVPEHVSLDKAALCEPLACGFNAALKVKAHLGADFAAARALVCGGGAIGLGAALALRALGLRDSGDNANILIIEPHAGRAEIIRAKTGFTCISPEDLAADAQFDCAIDGVGIAATRATCSAVVRPGGVIAHIGLGSGQGGLDIRRLTLQQISFVGCYTYSPDEFRQTAQALFSGALGALDWMELRPLAQGAQAFADLRAGMVASPKIILTPEH